MFLQTEYEFTLPRGYVDEEGNVHRQGIMKLVTAQDEIDAKNDSRAGNADYLSVLLLSRVVSRLGEVENITPEVIGKLFPADFAFLQNMYETINNVEEPAIHVQCPYCHKSFSDTLNFAMGE